jgi:lactoylglutathione lyase
MSNTNNHLQIELHVPDFDVVLDFYGKLGFKKVWHRSEDNNADYLVMERDGTILNFWPGNENVYDQSYFKQFPKDTKRGYGVELVITVNDVQQFHEKIKDFAKIVNPLVKRPWGLWDFRIEDPFGYYLRITEKHDITSPDYAVEEGVEDDS